MNNTSLATRRACRDLADNKLVETYKGQAWRERLNSGTVFVSIVHDRTPLRMEHETPAQAVAAILPYRSRLD